MSRVTPPEEHRPPMVRLRQGLALLVGALIFVLAVGSAPGRFYLTPLALGLSYLAAAALGGRRGGYWATACVLVGWGVAVVVVQEVRPDLDVAGLYLLGAGAGAAVGVVLARGGGFAVDPLGLALTVALGGAVLALSPQWPEVLTEARFYALVVGLVGLANAVAGAISSRAQALL